MILVSHVVLTLFVKAFSFSPLTGMLFIICSWVCLWTVDPIPRMNAPVAHSSNNRGFIIGVKKSFLNKSHGDMIPVFIKTESVKWKRF